MQDMKQICKIFISDNMHNMQKKIEESNQFNDIF